MWMALFGAVKEGAEIDMVLLNEFYYNKGASPSKEMEVLGNSVRESQGIVIASPVYFGDCTNSVSLFLEDYSLEGKVVGIVSVGAKRNGGQETTNIYTLMDALSKGAIIVGNGPPTSQYGGTGWAGDVGAILDDNFGLDSSLGTGKRVMEVVKQGQLRQTGPAKLTVIANPVSENDALINEITEEFAKSKLVGTSLIRIDEYNISPCQACSICPKPNGNIGEYGCIIEDDMKALDSKILSSDGLAFVIDDTPENKSFWRYFKVFIERTRHLRRDHFALADLPVIFFWKKDIKKNRLSWIKTATYMLRQNTFMCGPLFTRSYLDGKEVYQNISVSDVCQNFVFHLCRRRHAVEQSKTKKYVYSPIGYK
jgi:multimeric flavodoxin WrbA